MEEDAYDSFHKVEVVLDNIVLTKHIQLLTEENKQLRNAIYNICCKETSMPKNVRRPPTDETKLKWEYYHAHKGSVLAELSRSTNVPENFISWQVVKTKTDELFVMSSSPQSVMRF